MKTSLSQGTGAQRGSAVVAALLVLAVTFLAVGVTLFEASHRLRISFQSERWAQAGQAAEAGSEMALLSAQKGSWVADGWTTPGTPPVPAAPGAPGTPAVTKSVTLNTGLPATGAIAASVAVDSVSINGGQWLRIRSTGSADVFGGSYAGIDARDSQLRKLSLHVNRVTASAVTAPQATRMVEVLAKPASPFVKALLLNKAFNMSGGGWIDSFDSSDPTKSTNGLYVLAKRQSHGDVGVNDTQGASDLKNTFVYGNVAYSGPAIANVTDVQGAVTTPFSKPVAPVLKPTWTTFNATPTVINNTATLTGGTQASPALYKVSSLTVSGGKVLTLAPNVAGQQSYLEIWVTGSFTTSGSGYILQQPGVHVTYHIEGDITVSGSSFNNQSNIAANNIIESISPAAGVSQKVTVSGSGNFIGAIDAPGADFDVSGSANLSGAFIARTIIISGGASVHYDEALARASGSGGSYTVASWVEGVR